MFAAFSTIGSIPSFHSASESHFIFSLNNLARITRISLLSIFHFTGVISLLRISIENDCNKLTNCLPFSKVCQIHHYEIHHDSATTINVDCGLIVCPCRIQLTVLFPNLSHIERRPTPWTSITNLKKEMVNSVADRENL